MSDNNAKTWITTLCIFSLVATGLTMVYDFMLLLIKSAPTDVLQQAMQQSQENMKQFGMNGDYEIDFGMLYRMIDNAPFHLLFNIIEIIGILLIMKKIRNGLHFYIASQIGFAYLAFVTFQQNATLQILFCIIWAWLYWHYTKRALS